MSLQAGLLARLSYYAAPALYEEFTFFRDGHAAMPSPKVGVASDAYGSFVREMRRGLFRSFILGRPALARLLVVLTRSWMSATQEFIDRLTSDRRILCWVAESSGCSIDQLSDVQTHLSDPHNGGRTVLLLSFRSGARLLYKPRSLAIDEVWAKVTAWLESCGGPSVGPPLRTADMGGYGWQAFCAKSAGGLPSRFYYRTGAALALFRALGSSDMHHENLVANGDQPVFVDVETLVSPVPRFPRVAHVALESAEQLLLNSVWRSGVLPGAMVLPTGAVMSFGALSDSPGVSGTMWDFVDVNTKGMRFLEIRCQQVLHDNIPRGETGPHRPGRFVADLRAGFEHAMAVVRERWEELWGEAGPLSTIKSCPLRVILRPTATYNAILHMLRDPRRLANGIAWSSQLELGDPAGADLGVLSSRTLLAVERRALMRGDVPFFVTCEGQTAIRDGAGRAVLDAIVPTGRRVGSVPKVIEREDLERDLQLLLWSLAEPESPATRPWPSGEPAFEPQVQSVLFEAEVQRLARIVAKRAVRAGGGVAWWGRKSLLSARTIAVLGAGLYDGLTGIAIFLAAYAKVLSSRTARTLAQDALTTVQAIVRRHRVKRAKLSDTLGMAFGMAGVSYGMVTVARLLGEASWAKGACDAAAWITPEIIRADRSFDILSGTAGAAIGLLHLYEYTNEEQWLTAAVVCGDHLVAGHRNGRWWAAKGRVPTVGMAHGLAGIGLALSRLHRASGRNEFGELGIQALNLTNQAYDDQAQDWSSEMPGGQQERSYWCRWCHGALGVGLAWHDHNQFAMRGESATAVARATQAAIEHPTRPSDTLCCGNFGNVEYLLEVATADSPLASLARWRAEWLIRQRHKRSAYDCESVADEEVLGLFSGIAGIGYSILRVIAPQMLPSVLAFR